MSKIKPKLITITRAEGRIDECVTVTARNWSDANSILFRWSYTAPEHGGYDKCDFRIEFEDGGIYEGRFDLMHYRREFPNLAKHVDNHVRFLAGELPKWCSSEDDIAKVRRLQKRFADEGTQAEAQQWLETYETL